MQAYMKFRFLAIFLILSAGTLMAQESAADSASAASAPRARHFAVGITGGIDRNYHSVDMSYMQDYKYDEYCSGTAFGLQLSYMPFNWLAVRGGAVLLDKDYSMNHIFQYEGGSSSQRIVNNTYTANRYVNFPLIADLSFGRAVRLHAFGGGYYGYWLSSHRSGVSHSMGGGSSDNFDEEVVFSPVRDNRQEYGFVYGGGVSAAFIRCLELFAEARWYYSVTDIQNPYQLQLNPRYNTTLVFQGGARYLF